jgi:hypothetical protein
LKVIAVISYKYDEDHLEDLSQNLSGLADEIIFIFDSNGDLLRNEGAYREGLVRKAEQGGADYMIAIDPDERFERRTAARMRKLMKKYRGQRVFFEFNYREMYSPKKYRFDGIWGTKTRIMIFPLFEDNVYSDARLHSPHQPLNTEYKSIHTGLNVYHLKHIRSDLRENRRDTYKSLDPTGKYNPPGYDYLDDNTGLRLKRIGMRRSYLPRYRHYEIDPAIFDI